MISTTSDSQAAAALLAHVVAQVEQNIQFLNSQNYISTVDAQIILSKLPSNSPSENTRAATVVPPPIARRGIPVPPGPRVVKATALWAYNEDGLGDANDLSFSVGEVIDVLDETNGDWWMGRARGKEGYFPSNHVEKVETTTPPRALPLPILPSTTISASEKAAYKPFMAAHHGADVPPATGKGTNSLGLQQDAGQEQKKAKYGKLGNTMAHSAAGGVGFGAGKLMDNLV
ncbi:hypothetical protein JAAARDRAFT_130934 [Jaapia argillacea MUCL 33604]|uniref:SH3 domain-containing protein n=1 Tax=Jaapia argillacea MUCL 33604 TaxID=933084 RepID=A0A067PQK6_9AGAM|nr:hypothetical protein JAAARDRAFT_130934 [Jaapia argillacea MUCL 33604]